MLYRFYGLRGDFNPAKLLKQDDEASGAMELVMKQVNFIDLTDGKVTEIDQFLEETKISGIDLLKLVSNLQSSLDFLLNEIIGKLNDGLQEKGRVVLVKDSIDDMHLYFIKAGDSRKFLKFIVKATELGIYEVDNREFGICFCGSLSIGQYDDFPYMNIALSEEEHIIKQVKEFFEKIHFKEENI